jgi:hypothetical protein
LERLNAIDASSAGLVCFPCLDSSKWVIDASHVVERLDTRCITPAIAQTITTDSAGANKTAIETNIPLNPLILRTATRFATSSFAVNAASEVALNRVSGGMHGSSARDSYVDKLSFIEAIMLGKAGLPTFIDSVFEPVRGGR